MKTFKHNGKIGDVIFSLPTIRELGGGVLYLPERTPDSCNNLYSSLKGLLLQQPYIKEVREYPSGLNYMELAPDIHIDYDLDRARLQPLKGVIHIVKRYMDAFGINYPNWKESWLHIIGDSFYKIYGDYAIINYTNRHIKNDQLNIESKVDWREIIENIKMPIYFIGTIKEYKNFRSKFNIYIPAFETNNMLEVARIIRDAKVVYCNQSSVLALCQALSKPYYLEVKPKKTNCLMYSNNENILT